MKTWYNLLNVSCSEKVFWCGHVVCSQLASVLLSYLDRKNLVEKLKGLKALLAELEQDEIQRSSASTLWFEIPADVQFVVWLFRCLGSQYWRCVAASLVWYIKLARYKRTACRTSVLVRFFCRQPFFDHRTWGASVVEFFPSFAIQSVSKTTNGRKILPSRFLTAIGEPSKTMLCPDIHRLN